MTCHRMVQPRLDCADADSGSIWKPGWLWHDVVRQSHVHEPDGKAKMNARHCRNNNHPKHPSARENNVEGHAKQPGRTCRRWR